MDRSKLKKTVVSLLKIAVTVAIFVSLFAEFGGGPERFPIAGLADGTAFQVPNPAMPGAIGKVRARLSGTPLPEPTVPLAGVDVCTAAVEGPVLARTVDGDLVKIKALRHCDEGRFTKVLASGDSEDLADLAAQTGDAVWLVKQGKQRVPMDVWDVWHEIRSIDPRVFVPWFVFAIAIKLVGILANIVRWKLLLDGQGLRFDLKWLTASYFVGRFFGIVMPSTIGLDGWRLYDTIRVTRKPVECTTVIAVERVIGLVGLLATILIFMPFTFGGGAAGIQVPDLAQLLRALALPIGAALAFGVLLLLQPGWFRPLVRFVPIARVRGFVQSAIDSATAYSSKRGILLAALGCAVFGQVTTTLMYFGNAMALQVEGVGMLDVMFAAAVMTVGTFLIPSAAGEGVRELFFVQLLGGQASAASAFLIGHLGFWIEKFFLSVQGGWWYLRAPEAYQRVTADDLARLRAETAAESPPTPAM